MIRIAVKWGVLLAVAIGAWTLALHFLGIYTVHLEFADLLDRVALLLPLVALGLAILEERRAAGGAIGVGRAVGTGSLAAAVSAPLSAMLLLAYHHLINPQWLELLVDHKRQALAEAGVSPEEIAATIVRLQQGGTDGQQIVGGIVGTIVMGVILSVLLAAVVAFHDRRRRGAAPMR